MRPKYAKIFLSMSKLNLTLGDKAYFPFVEKAIQYEGRDSDNPLAFKFYDPSRTILGKPMKDLFRFAVAYWHTFCGTGNDPFGPGVKHFPWDAIAAQDPLGSAFNKADAAIEFITKMGMSVELCKRVSWVRGNIRRVLVG